MNYIVAVSGGVDSVVLLDMMVKRKKDNDRIIVAHFNHGIRVESDTDCRFVEALAKKYEVLFTSKREELGSGASEALARERRYAFLNELASQYNAKIVTAHHQDDLIETIAINVVRGTGWRGLSVLKSNAVMRPLTGKTKAQLYDYALKNNLEWVEDETNQTDAYLRNRIRRRTKTMSEDKHEKLIELWNDQLLVRQFIESELRKFDQTMLRYFYIMIDEASALEILRRLTNAKLTRPQLLMLLHAIKTARIGTVYEAGNGVRVEFGRADFVVQNTGQLL